MSGLNNTEARLQFAECNATLPPSQPEIKSFCAVINYLPLSVVNSHQTRSMTPLSQQHRSSLFFLLKSKLGLPY